MMSDASVDPFVTALEAACDAMLDEKDAAEKLQDQLLASEKRSNRIRALIDELLLHVPESKWPSSALEILGYNQHVQLQLDIGSPVYAELLKIVFGGKHETWTSQSVAEALTRHGYDANRKFISNTLARLVDKGAMRKVARGTYMVEEDRVEMSDEAVIIRPRIALSMDD